jgi:RimJ/RimL family protein N-acetyltransferase
MCNWALQQSCVTKVVAETEKDNIPSQKVLKKCNMKIFKETKECFWWELGKEDVLA